MPDTTRDELRRQLGAELKRRRQLAGVSGRALADRIGSLSQSKISRIERGEGLPTVPEVRAWLTAVEADDAAAARVLRIVEASWSDDSQAWRVALAGVDHLQDQVSALEQTAGLLRSLAVACVPGLLQTSGYARAVMEQANLTGEPIDYPAAVAARARRQQRLYDDTRRSDFIVTEAALRWQPAPGLARAQLGALLDALTLTTVTLGIVPAGAPSPLPRSGFVVYDDRGDQPPLVRVELAHAVLTITHPDDVEVYRRHWQAWRDAAVFGDQAADLLRTLAAQHAHERPERP